MAFLKKDFAQTVKCIAPELIPFVATTLYQIPFIFYLIRIVGQIVQSYLAKQ